jgi:hypothetical protein
MEFEDDSPKKIKLWKRLTTNLEAEAHIDILRLTPT